MIDLAKVPPELFAPILAGNLRRVAPSRKLVAHFLEAVSLRLAVDACWVTRAGQGERLLPGGRLLHGDPRLCDEPLALAFLRREHPAIPGGVVLASLVVHGRHEAVVGAVRRGGEFEPASRRALERLCGVLAEELAWREDERLTRVLDRIREKIVSELRPRDLAYQILDGLHQLVDYDHSAAFLAFDRASGTFRVEAEKIVWTKAKSPFVGREIHVPREQIGRICRAIEIRTMQAPPAGAAELDEAGPSAAAALGEAGRSAAASKATPPDPATRSAPTGPSDLPGPPGLSGVAGEAASAAAVADLLASSIPGRADPGPLGPDPGDPSLATQAVVPCPPVVFSGAGSEGVAGLLDYQREAGMPPVTSLLAAPLFYGDEFLGILKVAAWRRRPFAHRDADVVERFLPAAAVSMRNARVNRSLEMQAIEAEVKASLVTLSHAVAHDVNNAVGSILPLAQQMRFDLRHGPLDRETLDRDLGVIIENARLCQRIFSNMLRVAGSGRAHDGPVDAAQVVAESLPFLLALAGRRGIEIALDLAPDLPPVRFRRQDLQHVVLNLVRNSIEALAPAGASSAVAAAPPAAAGSRAAAGVQAAAGLHAAAGPQAAGGEAARAGGQVEIGVRLVDGGGVELFVADDGPGIPPELLSKVQEPFFSTRPGGTGLGLAICRALAWQNGATLSIESPAAAPAAAVPAPAVLAAVEQVAAVSTVPGASDLADEGGAAARGTRVTLRLAADRPVRPREAR